eukprot:GHVT01086214.1.p1 GENE.GHVT01086214.1~~GHVT01086214.1.p1  ORF type:complete len:577 (+),score=104.26 GHVT01086214.1:78-1733(+)
MVARPPPRITSDQPQLGKENEFLNEIAVGSLAGACDLSPHKLPKCLPCASGFCGAEVCPVAAVGLQRVGWLPGFFGVPIRPGAGESVSSFSRRRAYQAGYLFGMDASSGAAVAALRVKVGARVCDLCAAPGAKLLLLSDLAGPSGVVCGVDRSGERLALTRRLIAKYQTHGNVVLFNADGTRFGDGKHLAKLHAFTAKPTGGADGGGHGSGSSAHARGFYSKGRRKRRRRAGSERSIEDSFFLPRPPTDRREAPPISRRCHLGGLDDARAQNCLKPNAAAQTGSGRCEEGSDSSTSWPLDCPTCCTSKLLRDAFDRVLVDAECTHDGSARHVFKTAKTPKVEAFVSSCSPGVESTGDPPRSHAQHKWACGETSAVSALRMLGPLQQSLLVRGFELLRPGGLLVYSTCSFSKAQNEDVVAHLLQQYPATARLYPLPDLVLAGATQGCMRADRPDFKSLIKAPSGSNDTHTTYQPQLLSSSTGTASSLVECVCRGDACCGECVASRSASLRQESSTSTPSIAYPYAVTFDGAQSLTSGLFLCSVTKLVEGRRP